MSAHKMCVAGLYCCCLALVVNTVSVLRMPEGSTLSPDSALPIAKLERARALASYSAGVKRNPFGLPAADKPEQKVLPAVSSVLRLVGTLAGKAVSDGLAVIEKKGGEQGVFSVGEQVFGSSLVEIRPRAVVLRRNGRLELLAMDSAEMAKSLAAMGTPEARHAAVQENNVLRGSISRKAVKDVLGSPQKVSREIVLIPGKRAGRQGLFVRDVRKNGLLSSTGLQKGDLLLAANGQELSVRNNISSLRSLMHVEELALDIMRGGKQKRLTVTIEN